MLITTRKLCKWSHHSFNYMWRRRTTVLVVISLHAGFQEIRTKFNLQSSFCKCMQNQLAMRGNSYEWDGNLKAVYTQDEGWWEQKLAERLKSKENSFKSPEIKKKSFFEMGIYVILRKVLADFEDSPFPTVMANETTHSSNWKQVSFIFCQVPLVHEWFVSAYIHIYITLSALLQKHMTMMNHFVNMWNL